MPLMESPNPHINQTIMQSIGFIVPPLDKSKEQAARHMPDGPASRNASSLRAIIGSHKRAIALQAALNAANLTRQSVPEFVMGGTR